MVKPEAVKIIWSDFAKTMLKEIFLFHKETVSISVANKIKNNIFSSVKSLVDHPNMGQIEESLLKYGGQHRYLVSGNYKIIYKQINRKILITDVFDTRMSPTKMNNPNIKR